MVTLDKIEEIRDLRKAWPNEALDFTPWLAREENITELSETLGIDITVDKTEAPVGACRIDILAHETGTNRKIIIENQLEDTNHEHLGKLIAYASGENAGIIIWLVKRAKEEHRSAIEWFNNHTDDTISFFLCEIKLYKIGNSNPAVKYEIIEQPNGWSREIKNNRPINKTEQLRYDYWQNFQDYAFQNESFARAFRRRKASFDHWKSFSIGVSGCSLCVLQIQKRNELDVGLCIDDNKALFAHLFKHRHDIESETGLIFEWKELPNKKSCQIIATRTADFSDKGEWPEQFEWLIDVMTRMKSIFKKYL